jgi:uncharacterized protein YcbX
MATVEALAYYPIKGCAGVTVEHAVVTECGLAHDRSFVVVEPDGTFLSQRKLAEMAVVGARMLHGGSKMMLTAPDAPDLMVDVLTSGPERPVAVHKWVGTGIDQGDDAAGWLFDVLGREVRLVGGAPGHSRAGSGEIPGTIAFADSTALTIASVSSLDELTARLLERGADAVPMNRFRPNIVVTGWPEPHTEDRVHRMSAGTVEIGYGKRDVRCAVVMVDQLTGRRAGPEPLRTLATYRREPEGGVSFAMKAAVLRPGTIMVGDKVTVHEWR